MGTLPRSVTLSAAEWSPDMPDYANPGSSYIMNAMPVTPQSYGPVQSLQEFGDALPERAAGCYGAQDKSGNNYLFAGTPTTIHLYTGPTPTDVSGSTYNLAGGERWSWCQFGERVIAANKQDTTQSYVLGSSIDFSDLDASAPKARACAVVKSFLVLANTYDGTGGDQPQRVWWSGVNDPTYWPTPGSAAAVAAQSSYNDLVGTYGACQSVVGELANADGAVFQQRGVQRMVYTPGGFEFYPVGTARGTPAPWSVIKVGAVCYYLGENGFIAFDGINVTQIGVNKVDQWLFDRVDLNRISEITASVHPTRKLVYWSIPNPDSQVGVLNYHLGYNWALGRWGLFYTDCHDIFKAYSFGYTLDTMPNIPLDDTMFPLDSPVWSGGAPVLGGFTTGGKLGYWRGANLEAEMESSEQVFSGDGITQIGPPRPIVDGGTPSVRLAYRNRLIDSPAYTGYAPITASGVCPVQATGRYMRASIKMPAGEVWHHFQGVEVPVGQAGRQ